MAEVNLAQAALAAFTGAGGLGMLLRFLDNRITAVKKDVDKIDTKYDKILDVLKDHGEFIAGVKVELEYLRKNGK